LLWFIELEWVRVPAFRPKVLAIEESLDPAVV
jgi:hypothetical protein